MPIDDSSQHPSQSPPDNRNRRFLSDRMQLLVSVRDPEEVEAAISGGADWLDLKEPDAGPLGAVSPEVARSVVDRIGDRVPISAALGELLDWNESPARELLDIQALKVVKLGMAGCHRLDDWQGRLQSVAKAITDAGRELAVVAYADWERALAPPPAEVIAMARSVGSRYFLIDTYDKTAGSLLNQLCESELIGTLRLARESSLTTVVAGSLQLADLATLTLAETDIVGVRGSVCGGDRTARLDPLLVAGFRSALSGDKNRMNMSSSDFTFPDSAKR